MSLNAFRRSNPLERLVAISDKMNSNLLRACRAGRRYLHTFRDPRADCRTLLRHRHAHPARRRPATAPARLRGDLYPPRRPDGSHLPWPEFDRPRRRNPEHSNIPANAPHQFHNASGEAVRMLCIICSPTGQEKFFLEVGVPVATRIRPPPKLSEKDQVAFIEKVKALAPKYRTELLREA
jgi:hypothetical protein